MTERPLWTSRDELEFQIGFDMPVFLTTENSDTKIETKPKRKGIRGRIDGGNHPGKASHIRREQESQKQLEEALTIPVTPQPPAERKHITRTGK